MGANYGTQLFAETTEERQYEPAPANGVVSMGDDGSNYQESTIRARARVTPEQFRQFIAIIATLEFQQPHLQLRDELLFQYMYDLGLRVSEVVDLKVEHLKLDADPPHVFLPSNIQKQPPGDNVKPPARMKFDLDDTVHKTQLWLNTRWIDSEYLFPSQKGGSLLVARPANRRCYSRAQEYWGEQLPVIAPPYDQNHLKDEWASLSRPSSIRLSVTVRNINKQGRGFAGWRSLHGHPSLPEPPEEHPTPDRLSDRRSTSAVSRQGLSTPSSGAVLHFRFAEPPSRFLEPVCVEAVVCHPALTK